MAQFDVFVHLAVGKARTGLWFERSFRKNGKKILHLGECHNLQKYHQPYVLWM